MPLPDYHAQIFAALVDRGIPWCLVDGEPAFAWPAIVPALQLQDNAGEPGSLATYIDQLIADGDLTILRCPAAPASCHNGMVHFGELAMELFASSTLPACRAYHRWMCCEVLPAIRRHGHYDPGTGHEAPVGQELDALERKEAAIEHRNAMLPVLGLRLLVDEDGHETFVNDADLPDDEEA
jgi:hypothetical protein